MLWPLTEVNNLHFLFFLNDLDIVVKLDLRSNACRLLHIRYSGDLGNTRLDMGKLLPYHMSSHWDNPSHDIHTYTRKTPFQLHIYILLLKKKKTTYIHMRWHLSKTKYICGTSPPNPNTYGKFPFPSTFFTRQCAMHLLSLNHRGLPKNGSWIP